MTTPRLGVSLPPVFMPWRLAERAQPGSWYTQTPAELGAELDLVRGLGVRLVRFELPWNLVQPKPPSRGRPDWARTDLFIDSCVRRGLEPLPALIWSPAWAAAAPNRPPRDTASFAAFAALVAHRYAGRVGWLELWNEPNLARYWLGSLEEYAAGILREGARGVRRASEGVRVVMAGLAQGGGLGQVLAVERESFDAANLHYYPPRTLAAWRGEPERAVGAFRRTLAAGGCAGTQVWLSEVGGLVDTSRPADASPVLGLRGQVRLLRRAVRAGADVVLWYTLRDPTVYGAEGPIKTPTWGLFDVALRPRPAAASMRAADGTEGTPEVDSLGPAGH